MIAIFLWNFVMNLQLIYLKPLDDNLSISCIRQPLEATHFETILYNHRSFIENYFSCHMNHDPSATEIMKSM